LNDCDKHKNNLNPTPSVLSSSKQQPTVPATTSWTPNAPDSTTTKIQSAPPDIPTTAMATVQQSLSTNRFAALAEEDDEDDEEAKHTTACPDTAATGHFIPPRCKGKQLPH